MPNYIDKCRKVYENNTNRKLLMKNYTFFTKRTKGSPRKCALLNRIPVS